MRAPHALASLPVAAVLLTGCAADPAEERRSQVAAVIDAANAGDADRVRDEADRLVETVSAQQERQEVPSDEATRLIALAESVRDNADVIDTELLEQRRREAEAEAERKRLEEERQRLEAERKQLEEDRKKAEEERDKAEEEAEKRAEEERKKAEEEDKKKGEGKDDD